MSEVYVVVEDGGRVTTLFEREEDARRYNELTGTDPGDFEAIQVLDAVEASDLFDYLARDEA